MGLIEHVQFAPRQSNNPESRTTTKKKSRKKWAEIDNYLVDVLIPSDHALDAALQSIHVAGLPAHSVSPNQGKLLMLLAQTIAARHILEIGTLGGYSTIWLARALAPKGRLITLEANPMHAKIALANVAHAGLADRVDLRLGAALDSLPTLAAEKPFDFIYIDADRANLESYFQWALKLSRRGALIVADNVCRHAAAVKKETSTRRSLDRFFSLAAAEPKVSMTAIQTVGVNGHDGFAIALVTADP
jgi:predicted O-methyltransferase YrrM